MINDDILIKYSISRISEGHLIFNNWVDYTKFLSLQIREIRDLDFSGIGLDDLEIIRPCNVSVGDRIILCDYLDLNNSNLDSDCASILGLVTRVSPGNQMIVELEIEGIGHRPDLKRDPDRKLTWGKKIFPNLSLYPTILRVTSKPRADGGSVYYFFNKSDRDSRENYVPGEKSLSRRAILGKLKNVSKEDLGCTRERAQFMHTYRRMVKELRNYLSEEKKDKLLGDILGILLKYGKINKYNSKQISTEIWEKLNEGKKYITGE